MDLSFFSELYVPIIIAACLIVGYIIKRWIKDVDNKWIPTIVTILGAALGALLNGFGALQIIAGAASGLASTGLHQLFTQLIEGKSEEPEAGEDD